MKTRLGGPKTLFVLVLILSVCYLRIFHQPRVHHHSHNAQVTHVRTQILVKEKELQTRIWEELDLHKENQVGDIIHDLESREPDMFLCPVSKRKFYISMSTDRWRSTTPSEETAIASPFPLDSSDGIRFQATCFSGSGKNLTSFPEEPATQP